MQAQNDRRFSGGAYGNFTMNIIAQTKELLGQTDTLVNGSEILHTDMMDGPFEIAVRNWQLTGNVPYSQFHGDFGYMQTTPADITIHSDELIANQTVGHPYPINVSSDIDLYGGLEAAITSYNQTVFAKQPVDPYPFTGGSYEVYLANAPNHVYFNMPENTTSAKFSLYFYNGANDVDMGVYYDANGDGIPESDELVIPYTETATLNNPEVGTMMFPKAGPYIINAAGYDVAPGSLYNLTIETSRVVSDSPFSMETTNETIPAGTNTTLYLDWHFDDIPMETVETLLFISPGCALYSLVQPVNVTYDYYFNISLSEGWNLISLPWQTTKTSITNALLGISWDRAMVYINGTWHTYNKARDAKYNIGFPDVDYTTGIWVNVTAPSSLSGPASGIGGAKISLHRGWNLVGYPSAHDAKVAESLSGVSWSHIQAPDSSGHIYSLSSQDYLLVGRGYWIYVTEPSVWSVTA